MTIESRITKQTMHGNGVVREWPFTFRAWEWQVRVVIADPKGKETDVTSQAKILIYQEQNGGVVTYPNSPALPPIPSGWTLTVFRDMDFLQETDLVTDQRYLSEVHEERFDRLTAQDQQLLEGWPLNQLLFIQRALRQCMR